MQTQSIRTTDSYNQNLKAFNKNTGFKGIGTMAMQGAGEFFKICDEIPMIGVSVTDTVATNIPRTLVDLHQTGIPAAAETARREFSGLFVNCLIPGGFVFGAAKLINNHFMKDYKAPNGKIVNMSSSWANGEAIRNLTGVWSEYTGLTRDVCEITDEKLKEEALNTLKTKNYTHTGFIKNALKKVEGLDGTDNWKRLSDYDSLIEKASELLAPAMDKTTTKKGLLGRLEYNSRKNRCIKNAYNVLVRGEYTAKNELNKNVIYKVADEGFNAAQNLKFNGKVIGSDLKNLLRDTVDIGSALSQSKEARMNPARFAKNLTKMVNTKSLMGLGVIIPLAMSMQYINRAITRHKYKHSGAPIYKDFEKEQRVLTDKEKKQLKVTKPLAVSSIVGLALLSMGKNIPKNLNDAISMLQFNTKFPTINQCRVIATSTFASRMLASEDPNELRESTVRDLASFAGLYFLGDYAEKLVATGIQKFSKPAREGKLNMFNRTKNPEEYKNIIQKFTGWIKDTSIKTFDEIPKEYTNYRSLAKIGGLGFSITLLGVLLPMYNKHVTNKKEAKRKAILEQQKKQNIIFDPKTIFPSQKDNAYKTPQANTLRFSRHFKKLTNNPIYSKISSQLVK